MNKQYNIKNNSSGCFYGQLIGDALGTRYEFETQKKQNL